MTDTSPQHQHQQLAVRRNSSTTSLASLCAQLIQHNDNNTIYHKYIYINEGGISQHLKCSICTNVYHEPVVHTACMNTFCRSCIQQWTSAGNNSCVLCRSDVGDSTLQAVPLCIQHMLADLVVQCIQCNTQMTRSQYSTHTCRTDRPCTNGCGATVHGKYMADHIAEHCTHTTVQCTAEDLCDWSGPRSELQAHTAQCTHIHTYNKLNTIQSELDTTLSERNKYANLYSKVDIENSKLRNKLNAIQMDMLVERTVFSVYGSQFSQTQQAKDLVSCALELVESLYTFSEHVLAQDVVLQPYSIKHFLQPAIRNLNKNVHAIKQRYASKAVEVASPSQSRHSPAHTQRATPTRTVRVFSTEHDQDMPNAQARCTIM